MKLIKLKNDHYIIVDDSEIQTGDIVVEKLLTGKYELFEAHTINDIDKLTQKKITHSTQPIEIIYTSGVTMTNPPMGFINIMELSLEEVKELLGEVDVEKKAQIEWGNVHRTGVLGYIDGYNQALEDNKERKYTNEDMLTIRNQLVTTLPVGDVAAWDMIQAVSKYTKWFDEYIQSLQPKTEWEVEFINGKLTLKQ